MYVFSMYICTFNVTVRVFFENSVIINLLLFITVNNIEGALSTNQKIEWSDFCGSRL